RDLEVVGPARGGDRLVAGVERVHGAGSDGGAELAAARRKRALGVAALADEQAFESLFFGGGVGRPVGELIGEVLFALQVVVAAEVFPRGRRVVLKIRLL